MALVDWLSAYIFLTCFFLTKRSKIYLSQRYFGRNILDHSGEIFRPYSIIRAPNRAQTFTTNTSPFSSGADSSCLLVRSIFRTQLVHETPLCVSCCFPYHSAPAAPTCAETSPRTATRGSGFSYSAESRAVSVTRSNSVISIICWRLFCGSPEYLPGRNNRSLNTGFKLGA